ncbi:hypothetical protein ACFVQ4_25100 [Streptomyces laurentii]|uniref:hypothetical protein n=1 Tax=Streptomyces laurentii TaxID=39478 RepID=UPI0036BE8740
MTDKPADLRDQIAEALMSWAEHNANPQHATIRRPETVRRNAYGRADAVLAVLDAAGIRDAARQAAPWPYCLNCGHDWTDHGTDVCGVSERFPTPHNCGCTNAEEDDAPAARQATGQPASETASLRDQLRKAICEANGFAWDSDMLEPDEYGEHADVVLAVLANRQPAARTLTVQEHDRAWHAIEGAAGQPAADPGTVLAAVLHALRIQAPTAEDEQAYTLRKRGAAGQPTAVPDPTVADDPVQLRWGLGDVLPGDDDTVTICLSGPDREPYWLELDPERATALRNDLAPPAAGLTAPTNHDTETEARAARSTWRVEGYDANEWNPVSCTFQRSEDAHDRKRRSHRYPDMPSRIVRETTTWTIEPDTAAGAES